MDVPGDSRQDADGVAAPGVRRAALCVARGRHGETKPGVRLQEPPGPRHQGPAHRRPLLPAGRHPARGPTPARPTAARHHLLHRCCHDEQNQD